MRNNRRQKPKPKDQGVEASVLEVLSGDRYRLELEDGREILGYKAGKLRKFSINILVGDRVKVVLDPYGGHDTNRITYRL